MSHTATTIKRFQSMTSAGVPLRMSSLDRGAFSRCAGWNTLATCGGATRRLLRQQLVDLLPGGL